MKHPLIHQDPAIMVGKPVIKGRRITVEHVLRQLSAGATREAMKSDYLLTDEEITAALEYAADHMGKLKVKAAA